MNQIIVVGLGNPGEEYKNTRHNVGRMALEAFKKANDFPDWDFEKTANALLSHGKLKKFDVALIEPETFMNKSGDTLKKLKGIKVKTTGRGKDKKTEVANLIVVHDDLDIPLGKMKISFNKSSGGHKGVESINRAVGTEAYTRVRVGISPASAKATAGKPALKKPRGEEEMNKFIVGPFKPSEFDDIKKEMKKVAEALTMLVLEGREKAMGEFNR